MRTLQIEESIRLNEMHEIAMFSGLNETEMKALAMMSEFREYDEGELIIAQESVDSWLFIILEGRLSVSVKSAADEDVVVGTLRSGDIFGETTLFSNLPRQASVLASVPVFILALSRDQFTAFINEYPRAGLKLLGYIIYGLINKLASSNRNMAMEKECNVTMRDLEDLSRLFPPGLDDMLE
jgi:CRP-like cAMP-binding protein